MGDNMKKIFLLSLVFMLTINLSIFGQVQLDGTYYSNTGISVNSLSIPCTTGVGTDRLMLVGVSWNCNTTNRTISSVKFTPSGGSAINLAVVITQLYSWSSGGTAYRYSAIYSLLNPNAGVAGTVTIAFSGSVSNGIIAGVANFKSVDQSTPLGTAVGAVGTGTSTSGTPNPLVNLTGLTSDDLIFDNVFIGSSSTSQTLTADSPQSELWNINGWTTGSSFNTRGSSSIKQSPGTSTTMSWTTGSYGTTATRWAIAAVPIIWDNVPVPVELTSFTASVNNSAIQLNWKTATEVNNFGFEVERTADKTNWSKIAFVNGYGNSNSTKKYSFNDKVSVSGSYAYRLKQIDNDGKYTYSDPVAVEVSLKPSVFSIANYPNPFNPDTRIQFELPQASKVNLSIYNIVGQKVATLVDEVLEAGTYQRTFSSGLYGQLTSGIYFYSLSTDNGINITKKMVLAK
jgi:hypothetical protein